jgi:hypothetical protein
VETSHKPGVGHSSVRAVMFPREGAVLGEQNACSEVRVLVQESLRSSGRAGAEFSVLGCLSEGSQHFPAAFHGSIAPLNQAVCPMGRLLEQ